MLCRGKFERQGRLEEIFQKGSPHLNNVKGRTIKLKQNGKNYLAIGPTVAFPLWMFKILINTVYPVLNPYSRIDYISTAGSQNMSSSLSLTYLCCCSMHSPCTQGWGAQWSVPERHRGPWVLGGHMQWNPLTLFTQVPPLMHGFELHSLISTSHLTPIREQFRGSELYKKHPLYYCIDFSIYFILPFWNILYYHHVYSNEVSSKTYLYILGCTHICTR